MIASRPGSSQSGVALIMVLLAMALIVVLATGMTKHQSVRVYKAGHYLAQNQGYSIALGAEAFAKQILFRDFEEDKENNLFVDSPDEFWARYSALLPLDDGIVEIQIDDLGGRINLNDLVDSAGLVNELTRDRLERLFIVLGLTNLNVNVLIDWIDANDQSINAYGAEDGQYLMQDPPYRAANQPFQSVSELRLLEGITEEEYQALAPYVAALPVAGLGINVNMASGPVLQALHAELTAAQIESVLLQRQEQRFENMQNFLALPEFAGLGLKPQGLVLQTRFFEVASRITYDDRSVNLVSTVFRSPTGELSTVSRDAGQKNRITKERFGIAEGS